MSKRKNVSWRVADDPKSEAINQWLDAQKNIQDSLTNIVLHTIERFGIRNITDYDIQKMLYRDPSMPAIKQHIEIATVHSEQAHGQDNDDGQKDKQVSKIQEKFQQAERQELENEGNDKVGTTTLFRDTHDKEAQQDAKQIINEQTHFEDDMYNELDINNL